MSAIGYISKRGWSIIVIISLTHCKLLICYYTEIAMIPHGTSKYVSAKSHDLTCIHTNNQFDV